MTIGATVAALLLAPALAVQAAAQEGAPPADTVPFEPGMVVTSSVRIAPGLYEVPGDPDPERPLLTVRGDGVTLDLTGVELRGIPVEADPDRAAGTAILVDGGRDVRVTGGTVRGYRFGLLARGTRGLRLEAMDLSYGWKPRLFSRVAHESLVDWLSFHQNEEREWMRFGAAVYLEDVRGGEVRGVRAVHGMNGLLMVRTDSVVVRDNELAFNSGLGIGLYRSSRNTVVRNRLGFNVRGYSHGFYNRGQDSAGILLYEQSSGNVVAYNSATHGGDGLFLWAGQSTMDTGQGGANDNLIFHNDFSWAPTNGIEVTFSRNRLVANLLVGNRYGVWGGYSWETEIVGNCFGGNEVGVAIEHGQDNVIARNRFAGDSTAIELWANPTEPEGWGYPEHRDTRSRDHRVEGNTFGGHGRVWRLENTAGLAVSGNRFLDEAPAGACDPRALLGPAFDSLAPDLGELAGDVPRAIPEAPLASRDRSAMVVDAWGPYDWRSPKAWPADTTTAEVPLRVMGPGGMWRVVDQAGLARLSAEGGRTGDTLVVWPEAGREGDWRVELEYRGETTVSPRGTERPAGEAVRFGFERFEPVSGWDVRYFTEWPGTAGAPPPAELFQGDPAFTRSPRRLSWVWYRPPTDSLPPARWALEATTTVTLPPGEEYSIRTISDDGVRVWVDGELAVDHWEPHGSEVRYAPLAPGTHDLRVRYYQLDGWSELRVDVVRGSGRSVGSAGPH